MEDGRIGLFDARSLDVLRVIEGHPKSVGALAFSPDGSALASGGCEGAIRVWEVRSGERLLDIATPASRDLFSLCYTPDGRRLLSGSRQTSIGIWCASSGQELLRLHGHLDYVHELALSPDGRILASASGDNSVRLWDARPLAERISR
jgi:WD40 repeat protein